MSPRSQKPVAWEAEGERAAGRVLGRGRAEPGLGSASVTGVMARRTYLVNQHKHQSVLVVDQVLNLLEHLGYQLAALEAEQLSSGSLRPSGCLVLPRTRGPRPATVWAHCLRTAPGETLNPGSQGHTEGGRPTCRLALLHAQGQRA